MIRKPDAVAQALRWPSAVFTVFTPCPPAPEQRADVGDTRGAVPLLLQRPPSPDMPRTPVRAALFALLATLAAPPPPALAQDAPRRPVPYPVMAPPSFERAVERGTRTTTGKPGPDYWTNTADYDIQATLSPGSKMLRGQETVRYRNRSPDTLDQVLVHLRQNLHREGTIRNRPQQVTGGVEVARVSVDGQPLLENAGPAGYAISGTVMAIRPPEPVPPGGEVELAFAWSFEVPEAGAPRMGQDGEVFFLGYWYPQIAVYDDLAGWVADPYMGNGEFYMGYGTYDVAITVPEGWLVSATGTLRNPAEVLSDVVRERLAKAAETREVVSIVGEDEREAGTSTTASPSGTLTWRFHAEDVRDFAFGTSDRYLWDATSAVVGDRNGDGRPDSAMIHAHYRPDAATWERSAEFAQFSIEHLSEMLVPYPYGHMSTVEGIIGGGMEYPMLTLIGGDRNERSLFGVTYHEISHMWLPMLVGQNEKAYTWMDEGTTSFNTNEGAGDFFDVDAWAPEEQSYYRIAGTEAEREPMRHADEYPPGSPARVVASYSKPAVALHALRGILGEEAFMEAYRAYVRRWAYKHPLPYDLFNTFEDVAGRDLDWFWTSMLYETWTLDHAIADVAEEDSAVVVTVEDLGLVPMPALIRVTYADGTTERRTVPVETWLGGARRATLRFKPGTVEKVEADPEAFLPDVRRENNVFREEASGAAGEE